MADSLQAQTKTFAQPLNHRKFCFLCNFNVSRSYYCKIWSNRKGSEFQMKRRIELLIDEELPLSAFPTNFMCKNCTNSIEKLEELEEFKKKLKERILAALGPRLNKKRKRKDLDHDPSPNTQVCEDITKVKVESQSDEKYEAKIENGDKKEQYLDLVESQDLEENLGLQFKMEMEVSEHELIPEFEESEKMISPDEEVTVDASDTREIDDSETNEEAQDKDVPESGVKNLEEGAKPIDDTKKGKLPPMLLIKGPNHSQFVLMPSSSSNMACPPLSIEGQSLLQSNQKSVVKGSEASKSVSKSLTSLQLKLTQLLH
ncbi:uncharacterized protein LOC143034850 [Oratosquilla oratoria]|uniref:uncharacterized protein LOC143034850 n=1 Tax=Oratosquilla oratoria TaxID=337810 RepID=UPI003F76EAB3